MFVTIFVTCTAYDRVNETAPDLGRENVIENSERARTREHEPESASAKQASLFSSLLMCAIDVVSFAELRGADDLGCNIMASMHHVQMHIAIESLEWVILE